MQEQKHIWRILLIMGIFLAGMLGAAPGATYTWNGTISSDWSDSNNWSSATVPGPDDSANFNNTVTNMCVFPADTTQCVSNLLFAGFAAGGDNRKLVISPGSALHVTNTATKTFFTTTAGDRGVIEVQSNAMLTISNGNFYIGYNLNCRGTIDVNGGSFIMGNATFGVGIYRGTGIVHVSAGGYVKCLNTIYVGVGGNAATDISWGELTISNAGSRVETPTFVVGQFSAGGNKDAGGNGTVVLYDGTLSVTTYKNADACSTQTINVCYADSAIRGGQLLVSGSMYNSADDTNVEVGVVTIASGATNLLVGGSYYQRTNSTLVAEITAPNHPPLKVNGVAYLAGTLRVASNSVEQRGQWDIVIGDADTNSASPGLSGRFNTFDASAAPHPANWVLSYTDDKVILSYIPKGSILSFR